MQKCQGNLGKKKKRLKLFQIIFIEYEFLHLIIYSLACYKYIMPTIDFNAVLLGFSYCPHVYFMCIEFELKHCNSHCSN